MNEKKNESAVEPAFRGGRSRAGLGLLAVAAILAVGLGLRGYYALTKTDFHVDEGFSAAISNGTWAPGAEPAPLGRWIDSGELFSRVFSASLAVSPEPPYGAIAKSTGMDVHPPLYYWALAFARKLVGANNFALAGYGLNALLFAFSLLLAAFIARRALGGWGWAALAVAPFAFSAVSASLSTFLRMYELLQFTCLLWVASAAIAIDPPGAGPKRILSLGLGIAGLFAASLLGLLTQYYFLFFLAPAALASAVVLARRRRFPTLLWGLLATVAGLYLAYRVFPQMGLHLTGSYRAAQSVENIAKTPLLAKAGNVAVYLGMVFRNLVSPAAILAAVAAGIAGAIKARKDPKGEAVAAGKSQTARVSVPVSMAIAVTVFTLTIIPISAPYLTARYIGAFFPLYALAFAGLAKRYVPGKSAMVVLGATGLLALFHAVLPGSALAFHEDYSQDNAPAYMSGSEPLIVMTTQDGSWKNMLPYINLKPGRPVFVAYGRAMADVSGELRKIAATAPSGKAVALVDDLFRLQPKEGKIGYYGFFNVYAVERDQP